MSYDSGSQRLRPSQGLIGGVLAACLLLSGCADTPEKPHQSAGTEQVGVNDYSLVEAARNGDETALYVLATRAEEHGDTNQAIAWYRLGAEHGLTSAADSLGQAYERQGDFVQAAQWYRRALKDKGRIQGTAALHLAELILSNRIPGTAEEGGNYLSLAAQAGNRVAVERYGSMLLSGTGVPQDTDEGQRWLARAERAQARLNAPPLVSPPTGPVADFPAAPPPRLRDIIERVSAGSWQGMLQLGRAYELGEEGLQADSAKAEYWYAKAASLGSDAAHYALGSMIINGHRPGSPEEAAALVEHAAYGFVPDAEAAYGLALMTGRGVPADEVEGAYWMGRSALHGSAWGTYLLAKAYRAGRGVPRDEEIGQNLMKEVERLGYRAAD